jgi:hypothetical protein
LHCPKAIRAESGSGTAMFNTPEYKAQHEQVMAKVEAGEVKSTDPIHDETCKKINEKVDITDIISKPLSG